MKTLKSFSIPELCLAYPKLNRVIKEADLKKMGPKLVEKLTNSGHIVEVKKQTKK